MISKMPINDDLIRKRISEIREGVALLRRYLEKEFRELDISETLSIRYLIIQLVEAASSICMHILSSMYQEYPEGYPACFLTMAKKGLIPRDLGERLARAARLRNLLVHRYWEIDDEKVYEAVKRGFKDFIEFVKIIERLIMK